MKYIIYSKDVLEIIDLSIEKKIPLKEYRKYLSLKIIKDNLNKSGFVDLLKYDKSLIQVKLYADVILNKNIPHVIIYYKQKEKLLLKDKKKIKNFISKQILDGWNENGLYIKKNNNSFLVYLK